MTIDEFYNRFNLNKYNFASIAGVGTRTLIKFARGETIRENSKKRIELAMRVAEKYNLVRPRYDTSWAFDSWRSTRFFQEVLDYEARFKDMIQKERD